jgi:hypothetical protein
VLKRSKLEGFGVINYVKSRRWRGRSFRLIKLSYIHTYRDNNGENKIIEGEYIRWIVGKVSETDRSSYLDVLALTSDD